MTSPFTPPPLPKGVPAAPAPSTTPEGALAYTQAFLAWMTNPAVVKWHASWTGEQMWGALASAQGSNAAVRSKLAKRPAATADPATIDAWLATSPPISPVFAFPEWPWKFNYATSGGKSTASAAYDLASGNHVSWTADSDGGWHYDHTWGGVDLGVLLSNIETAVAVTAAVTGTFQVALFVNVLQAITDHSDLGAALKRDYDIWNNNAAMVFAFESGDWQAVWNAATQDGKDLTSLVTAFFPLPAPDAGGNLTLTKAAASAAPTKATPHLVLHQQPAPKAGPPMAKIVLHQLTQPGSIAAPSAATVKAISQSLGLSPPPVKSQTSLAVVGAPAPLAAPKWYQKTLFSIGKTPVTLAEGGLVAGALAAAAKFML